MVYTIVMKQLNTLFVLLFILIGILSISYIWTSEIDKKKLEKVSSDQLEKINSLENEVSELKNDISPKDILGSTTEVGIISGVIIFNSENLNDNSIVCAQDKFTIKEFCTDVLLNTLTPNELKYSLEIPQGKYFVYAMTPPDSKKYYHSKIQKCNTENECESDQKILLEVLQNEKQENINVNF